MLQLQYNTFDNKSIWSEVTVFITITKDCCCVLLMKAAATSKTIIKPQSLAPAESAA